MSKILKAKKKVLKKVGGHFKKGFKRHVAGFKKVGKAFKKFWGTTFGKIVISAAAIFLTWGLATGAFAGAGAAGAAGGTTAAQGALAGGAAGAGAAGGTAAMGAAAEAAAMGMSGYSVAGGLSGVGQVAAAGAAGAAAGNAAANTAGMTAAQEASALGLKGYSVGGGLTGTGAVAPAAVNTANLSAADEAAALGLESGAGGVSAGQTAGAGNIFGTIKDLGGGAANWVRDNQLLAAMGVNAIGNAMQTHQQYEDEKEDRRRWEDNLSVGNIFVGTPRGRGGLIGSRMGG